MPSNRRSRTVVVKPNDPLIYLFVRDDWYCYNPQESPLGSGAMGDVYLGYRCRDGLIVAVKRVKDCYANNSMVRERARQEASLVYRHPNLVEMVGYCEYAPDKGPVFLVSHFVKGENIDVYVKRIPESPNRVAKICNSICSVLDGLDYIHSYGVVHRDIKPSNIMVENGSNIRLMDLGISCMYGGNKFSSFGFIGTPQYSAPEQIDDDANGQKQINATTDIYQLGITFYELLTNENPMDCPSEADTLNRQIKEPLPSSPKIPKRLMQVIWKATEKDQAKRYQTAMDFKNAIIAAQQPEESFFRRFSSWMQDHFVLMISIVSLLVVLVFLLVLILI